MDTIYGKNPVLERLQSGSSIDCLFIQEGADMQKIISIARSKKVKYQFVNKRKLDSITNKANHQGVVASVPVHEYSTLEDILQNAELLDERPFLVIAENLTDPNNLGSIIRTANACGVHGVIVPKNRSVGVNDAVAKVSSGAVEYTPVARVTNVSSTIEKLKLRNIFVVGTDLEAEEQYFDVDFLGSIAIVVGSEGKGISRLVRERCDILVKIPMLGSIQSLNVSVAAGILMYEILRQRQTKQEKVDL